MAKKAPGAAPAFHADTLALIKERDEILLWLEPAKKREMEIRTLLAALFFPEPSEGTQRLLTADGFEVILNHKINRKVDESLIDAVMLELPEDAPERVPGVLIAFKPTLVLAGYKNLSADKLKIVSQAITATPGAPELTIAPAKPEEAAPGNSPALAPSATPAASAPLTATAAASGTPTADKKDRTAAIAKAVKAGKGKKAKK